HFNPPRVSVNKFNEVIFDYWTREEFSDRTKFQWQTKRITVEGKKAQDHTIYVGYTSTYVQRRRAMLRQAWSCAYRTFFLITCCFCFGCGKRCVDQDDTLELLSEVSSM